MNLVEIFIDDFSAVGSWFSSLVRNFFASTYGNIWSTPSIKNILFIVAALPPLMGFAAEILFSFILSFRSRKLIIFNPFKTSLYDLKSGRLPFGFARPFFYHGIRSKNSHKLNAPVLLTSNKPITSVSIKKQDISVFKNRGNEFRRFIPKIKFDIKSFHGFNQWRVRFSGVLINAASKWQTKRKGDK